MTASSPVYVAHPLAAYGTAHAAACLDIVAGLLPGARLIDPAVTFASAAEWRRAWPRLVRVLGGFVIFGAADGTIGAGCIRELSDAIAVRVPIAGFDLGRGLQEISGFDLIESDSRTARRTAGLRLGRCVERTAWNPGDRRLFALSLRQPGRH
jgi:hypothetical protein